MTSIYQKYIYFLDELRIEKGLKVVDFCEGICHERTYRKYLSGDNEMTQEKLNLFCQKLGFSAQDFYSAYNEQDKIENDLIGQFYISVYTANYEQAKILLRQLETITLTNPISIEYFESSLITYLHKTKKLTDMEAYDRYSKLIDYPDCLTHKHYNIGKLFALIQIAYLEAKIKEYKALEFAYSLLIDKKNIFLNSHTRYYLTYVYRSVAQIYGVIGDWEKCESISQKGIQYSVESNAYNHLQSFHYFISLARYEKKDLEGSRKAARKCLTTCISVERLDLLKRYLEIMKDDFKEDPMTYLNITSIDDLI